MSILASASGAPTLLPIANKILRGYSRTFAAQYFYLDLGGSCALLESRPAERDGLRSQVERQ